MSDDQNKLTKIPERIDGFEGFEDGIEGDDRPQGERIIQGQRLRFTNDYAWVTDDDEDFPKDRELVVNNIERVVQKWIDQLPVETIVLEPGQKFPNVKKWNDEAPRSEWHEGPDGKPCGPWQAQYVVYMLDPATMAKYCYPTGTTGGGICICELADKVKWMRKFRGANVYAIVTLADCFMRTRFGGRQRPHFKLQRWISFGSEGGLLPGPSTPPTTPTEGAFAAPAVTDQSTSRAKAPLESGAHVVEEPSLGEEMNDEIRW